jgi:hypothetical protein
VVGSDPTRVSFNRSRVRAYRREKGESSQQPTAAWNHILRAVPVHVVSDHISLTVARWSQLQPRPDPCGFSARNRVQSRKRIGHHQERLPSPSTRHHDLHSLRHLNTAPRQEERRPDCIRNAASFTEDRCTTGYLEPPGLPPGTASDILEQHQSQSAK